MKNWLMKCIEIFLIYIFFYFFRILNGMIVIFLKIGSLFHINFFNLLHRFFDESHV
jgi:hypothetical protein